MATVAAANAARREAYDFVRRGPQLGNSDAIGHSELDNALRRLGVRLLDAEIAAMVAMLDTGGTGAVSAEEFIGTMPPFRSDQQADSIAALLEGGAAERADAYSMLDGVAARHGGAWVAPARSATATSGWWALLQGHAVDAGVAMRCAAPLSGLMARPASQIGREEYMRVGLLCASLAHIDMMAAAEFVRGWRAAWTTKGTCLAAILAKHGAEITENDALLAACQLSAAPEAHQFSPTEYCRLLGVDEAVWTQEEWVQHIPYWPGHDHEYSQSDDDGVKSPPPSLMEGSTNQGASRNAKLVAIAEELLRRPDAPLGGASLVRPGLCLLIAWCMLGRPAIGKLVVQRGFVDWAVAALEARDRECSWVVSKGQPDTLAMGIWWVLTDSVTTGACDLDIDLTAVALQAGAADLAISVLAACKAMQEQGRIDINNGIVGYALWMLSSLDLRYSSASAVLLEKFRANVSLIKHILRAKLPCMDCFGLSTGTWGSKLLAIICGKDENKQPVLEQKDVEGLIRLTTEYTHPTFFGFMIQLKDFALTGVVLPILNMTVSDENKRRLLRCPGFIALLVDGLLLDPAHPRAGHDREVMAVVQRDYAESLQQLALFPEGREALLADPSIELQLSSMAPLLHERVVVMPAIAALELLAAEALSPEAKKAADGALLALGVQQHPPAAPATAQPAAQCRHIM
eukprot:SAG11_NODE_2357_length_3468_cov_1.841199_2_plen_688_part_00